MSYPIPIKLYQGIIFYTIAHTIFPARVELWRET